MAFNARRTKRLQREIGTLLSSTGQEDNCGICVEIPDEGNMMHIKAYLQGPPDTPYESGLFQLDVNFPTDYPLMPPKINFTTRIWHPNISSVTGPTNLPRKTRIIVNLENRHHLRRASCSVANYR